MKSVKLSDLRGLRSMSIDKDMIDDVIKFEKDLPIPEVPPGGARVKVCYAGACYFQDEHKNNPPPSPVNVKGIKDTSLFSGFEVSGLIDELSETCSKEKGFKVGDRVIIYPYPGLTISGYSEYVAVHDVRYLIKVQDNVPLDVAAMLPAGGLAAESAIIKARPFIENMLLSQDKLTIIIVGSGGLALWTLKFAKYMAEKDNIAKDKIRIVIACTNEAGLLTALDEGCHDVVHWNEGEFEQNLLQRTRNVCLGYANIIIDFVSSHRTVQRSLRCLADGGVLFVGGLSGADVRIPLRPLAVHSHSIVGVGRGTEEQLAGLVTKVSQGIIVPPPFTVFPIEKAGEVVRRLSHGEIKGRAVLKY
ncbi:uncharacterized protein LOC135923021 isoform X2 [Gordionus sp. m RMFG-2023]|uniref:uncharacterized protein LOC135923021 isoform X2 n=1 Tax=Gordionus sp. m RMFG-2023 TaxID=3053472 RepID=UPI0031FC7FCC